MGERWVPAQDLFDQWSLEEDELAFERAGGHAYDFPMTPPAPRPTGDLFDEGLRELDDELEDEFELEDALLDDQGTTTLRLASAEATDIISVVDDETTGTLAVFG